MMNPISDAGPCDNGSPVLLCLEGQDLQHDVMVGILSIGSKCSLESSFRAVFTWMDVILDWIDQFI